MKLIFTYDSTELEDIGKISAYGKDDVEEKHVLTIEKEDNDEPRKLYDVARDIKKETEGDSSGIIFINQYLKCADEGFQWLQKNAGIALIKFLRMMQVRNQIVLVTPYAENPLKLVTENPANLIITSKGVTCTKYLHKFFEKSLDELKTLAEVQFDENQDLKPYLKVDFELPQDNRHNWANWWGIYRLWYIHTFVKELDNKEDIHVLGMRRYDDYPYLKDHFKKLRNRVAMYLFGYKEAYLVNIFNQLAKLKKKVDKAGTDPNYIDSQIKFDDLLERQEKFRKSLKSIRAKEWPYKLLEFRNILKNEKPKILLVDDQAHEGWSDIFQRMINGDQDETVFQTLPCPDKDEWGNNKKIADIDAFYKTVIETIIDMRPDVVLLDLRLNGETGTWLNVEELSGAELFKMIREDEDVLCREVPVIITTASNKFWSFERLHQINEKAKVKFDKEVNENACSLGYWSKEGLDVIISDEDSIRNYIRFLELIIKPLIPV